MVSLILANIIAIFLTFSYGQDIISVLWLYWFQSFIFCLFSVLKIFSLRRFSAADISPPMEDNDVSAKMKIGVIFIFFYGIFHLVYAVFIGVAFGLFIPHQPVSKIFLLIGVGVFALHHIRETLFRNENDIPKLGDEFIKPFRRLIPMHLIIILGPWLFITGVVTGAGSLNTVLIVAFQVIKTAVDVLAYQWWKKSGKIRIKDFKIR